MVEVKTVTIFMVETYVVNPDKLGEFPAFVKKWDAFMKKRPALFKEMKSSHVFSQMFGGNSSAGIWMTEYESLAELEKSFNKLKEDKELMNTMSEWNELIMPGTHSVNIWTSVQ